MHRNSLPPPTLLYYLVNHPGWNRTLLLLITDCGWRRTPQLILPGLILNSSPNLRGAFSAALQSYYIFPSAFTLPHSFVAVSHFFLFSNLHTSYIILTLAIWLCLLFHWEKEQSGKRNPIYPFCINSCTVSTHFCSPVLGFLFCSCGWTTRASTSGPLLCSDLVPPVPFSPTEQYPGPWICMHSRHSA